LMGVNHAGGDDSEASDQEDQDESDTPSSRKKRPRSASKKKTKHLTPEGASSLLEDESLSFACRRLCAAIDFLVSYVRSSIMEPKRKALSHVESSTPSASKDQVRQIFELITQILRDKGLPPSNRDRRACKSRQDRAALRQCAAVHLLRLCDSRLGLEKANLTTVMWHTLGGVFLDEERVVREAVMEELSFLLSGNGIYGPEGSSFPTSPPALRFVALVVLCTDGDHGADHDGANGSAANVGKLSTQTKIAAQRCVSDLRNACHDVHTQCRATGKTAEQKFENSFKMQLMPEYMVPFAFHLLALRRESPLAEVYNKETADSDDDESGALTADDESQQRVLRKRLKFLFEPLVQSLGDTADNISFLLLMTETLGKFYRPVDAFLGHSKVSSSPLRLSLSSQSSFDSQPAAEADSPRLELLEGKLKTICVAAREVLLSFVKKDVNLTTYPGVIHFPSALFKKSIGSALQSCQQRIEPLRSSPFAQRQPILKSPKANDGTPSNQFLGRKSSDRKSRVHFSPELEAPSTLPDASHSVEEGSKHDFDDLSPIAKSQTPTPQRRSTRNLSSSADTLGTTPPSVLQGATIHSTAPEGATDEESPESKTSSPVVQSEIRHSLGSEDSGLAFDDGVGDEAIKTTSETQSTQDNSEQEEVSKSSETRGSRKRKPTAATQEESQPEKKTKRSKQIPLQIKINRSKPTSKPTPSSSAAGGSKKKRRGGSQVDEFDFDFADGSAPENLGRNKKSPNKSNSSSKKSTTAIKKGTSSKIRPKPKEVVVTKEAPRRALRVRR
jgi:hypothetical protein